MNRELLKRQFLVALVTLLSIFGILFGAYLAIITPTPYTKFLAFLFLFSAVVAAFFNIMGAMYFYRSYNAPMPEMKPLKRFPTVAMVVVSYNEPVDMVEETLEKLKNIEIGAFTINTVSLITANAVCTKEKTHVVGEYKLKK